MKLSYKPQDWLPGIGMSIRRNRTGTLLYDDRPSDTLWRMYVAYHFSFGPFIVGCIAGSLGYTATHYLGKLF